MIADIEVFRSALEPHGLHEPLNKLVIDGFAKLTPQGRGDAAVPVPALVAIIDGSDSGLQIRMSIAQCQYLGLVVEGAPGQTADGQQVRQSMLLPQFKHYPRFVGGVVDFA